MVSEFEERVFRRWDRITAKMPNRMEAIGTSKLVKVDTIGFFD